MDPHFKLWFDKWVDLQQSYGSQVWLISGSDLPKTVEQVGQDIVDKVDRCYNCMGNTLYQQGETVYEKEFTPSDRLIEYLNTQLEISPYPHRYGQHIEYRPGMINYSVVGRGAVGEQRTQYYKWDLANGEREHIAADINQIFHDEGVVALVGGETGLDITMRGWDKGQVIDDIHTPAVFLGDKMEPGENDYPLRIALHQDNRGFKHRSFPVTGWSKTLSVLSSYMGHLITQN